MKIVIILVIGIGFIISGLKNLLKYRKIYYWKKVDIEILNAELVWEIESILFSRVKYYYPKVSYRYCVKGVWFESEIVAVDKKSIWLDSKKNAQEKLESIVKHKCAYYNPKNYSEAVILKDIANPRVSHNYALVFIGIILCIFSIYFYFEL